MIQETDFQDVSKALLKALDRMSTGANFFTQKDTIITLKNLCVEANLNFHLVSRHLKDNDIKHVVHLMDEKAQEQAQYILLKAVKTMQSNLAYYADLDGFYFNLGNVLRFSKLTTIKLRTLRITATPELKTAIDEANKSLKDIRSYKRKRIRNKSKRQVAWSYPKHYEQSLLNAMEHCLNNIEDYAPKPNFRFDLRHLGNESDLKHTVSVSRLHISGFSHEFVEKMRNANTVLTQYRRLTRSS